MCKYFIVCVSVFFPAWSYFHRSDKCEPERLQILNSGLLFSCQLNECRESMEHYTHISGGDPGALGIPPSILMGLRNSSYGTASVLRAMSCGKEGATLPLGRGEGFRVTATSRGRPSSGMSPPGPGRRVARRLFILRYLISVRDSRVY